MILDLPRRLLSKSFEETTFRQAVRRLVPSAARAALMRGLYNAFLQSMLWRRVDARTILLADFPRCGNTWLRFMLASALHAVESGEIRQMTEAEMIALVPSLSARADLSPHKYGPGDNLLKTHLPHRPRFRRGVVTFRELYNSLPSLFAMDQWLAREGGSSLLTGQLLPPDEFLRYWAEEFVHIYTSWLAAAQRAPGKFLFIRYEEMVTSMTDLLPTILTFVGIDPAVLPTGSMPAIASMYKRTDVSWTSPEALAVREKTQAEVAPLLTEEALRSAAPALAERVAEITAQLLEWRIRPVESAS